MEFGSGSQEPSCARRLVKGALTASGSFGSHYTEDPADPTSATVIQMPETLFKDDIARRNIRHRVATGAASLTVATDRSAK